MSDAPKQPGSGSPMNAGALLDTYYLHMRSALLETAAAFDRIESASGGPEIMEDPRLQKLREACGIIAAKQPRRAKRFQELLSTE